VLTGQPKQVLMVETLVVPLIPKTQKCHLLAVEPGQVLFAPVPLERPKKKSAVPAVVAVDGQRYLPSAVAVVKDDVVDSSDAVAKELQEEIVQIHFCRQNVTVASAIGLSAT
jgi:hypothetical protein